MAGTAMTLTVDDRELSRFVTSVKRTERKAVKKALAAAVRPVVKAARANVRKGGGGVATLARAVRGGAWKRGGGATAYIRGPKDYRASGRDYHNFKLLFFEGGTAERFSRVRGGKKGRRGRIKAAHFFANAIAAKSAQGAAAFETELRKWIKQQDR